jgi:hypothetical protein
VPEATCARVHLGFADWRAIDVEGCRADAETLVVENAGRDLYLVADPETTASGPPPGASGS